MSSEWEQRVAQAWTRLDELGEVEFRDLIDGLAEELPANSGPAAFERACAFDSTGHSDQAVPLYERALQLGLTGLRRRRAVIQMCSSLRNVGEQERAIGLLTSELAATSDDLDDALRCVLALCLTDVGREREAVSIVVGALAEHLPRYQRSMADYARLLLTD